MKLNKENIQKLGLAALLLVAGLYVYFTQLLGPLSDREEAELKEVPTLEKNIADAKGQITRTNLIESGDTNAAAAKETFEIMKSSIPEGAAIAWFPQRISEFFRNQGVPKVNLRLNLEVPDSDLPGFSDATWSIEIPKIEFVPLAIAIAGLENQEGLMQVLNVQIQQLGTPNVQFQHAQLTVSTIVKGK